MKRTILILTLVIAAAASLTSCASQKNSGGCRVSQGYVGYGHSR